MSIESFESSPIESGIYSAYWQAFDKPITRGSNPLFFVNGSEFAGLVAGGPNGGHVIVDYRTGSVSQPPERTFEAAIKAVEKSASLEFEGPQK